MYPKVRTEKTRREQADTVLRNFEQVAKVTETEVILQSPFVSVKPSGGNSFADISHLSNISCSVSAKTIPQTTTVYDGTVKITLPLKQRKKSAQSR